MFFQKIVPKKNGINTQVKLIRIRNYAEKQQPKRKYRFSCFVSFDEMHDAVELI